MRCIVWALVLSLPLSVIAFGMADKTKCPDRCRWIFSPGYMLSMRLPPTPGHVGEGFSEKFSRDLGRGVGVGLLTNVAYYYLIFWASFIGFDLVREKRQTEA